MQFFLQQNVCVFQVAKKITLCHIQLNYTRVVQPMARQPVHNQLTGTLALLVTTDRDGSCFARNDWPPKSS